MKKTIEDNKAVSEKTAVKGTMKQETYINERGDLRVKTKFSDGTTIDREV